jgi:hypothetical protein
MKLITLLSLFFISHSVNAQVLSSRLGIDTGGGTSSGRIISFQENGTLSSLEVQALSSRRELGGSNRNRGLNKMPLISVDLNTVSEITLKDGTVINNEDVKELLAKRLELINKD